MLLHAVFFMPVFSLSLALPLSEVIRFRYFYLWLYWDALP